MKLILLTIFLSASQLFAIGEWNQKATFGGTARHRASAFAIGDKGYVGMGHYNTGEHVIFKDLWEYDPATDSWTQKADFGGTLRYQCAAFSIGDYGYMGLGRNEQDNYEQDFWKYDPSANMWYPIADYPGVARRGAAAFVINKKAYVGLGQTEGGYANDFYKYDPNTDSWTQIADFIGVARTSAAYFVCNEKGYVGTGHTFGTPLNDFYEYNPTSNYWVQKANVGDSLRQDACGFSVMNEGYIGTGNNVDGSVNYKDFWKYNVETDSWIRVADFGGVARRYMVSFVINNTAYCWGGTNGTNLKDLWSFNPYLSIDENSNENLVNVYPNPATYQITFNVKNLNNTTIEIYNSIGQLVMSANNISNLFVLEKNNLPSGLYYYKIKDNHQIIKTDKFIFK
jgi:N-acetylneuraminic acid mutarotase